jgi:hypothetical protein
VVHARWRDLDVNARHVDPKPNKHQVRGRGLVVRSSATRKRHYSRRKNGGSLVFGNEPDQEDAT